VDTSQAGVFLFVSFNFRLVSDSKMEGSQDLDVARLVNDLADVSSVFTASIF
jgi:hypothetical protein